MSVFNGNRFVGLWKGEQRGGEGRGRGGGEPDCPIFMHVYIVLCILCSMCRKEICVHVERAGWPDFLVHV